MGTAMTKIFFSALIVACLALATVVTLANQSVGTALARAEGFEQSIIQIDQITALKANDLPAQSFDTF
jgi:hypothetical protein